MRYEIGDGKVVEAAPLGEHKQSLCDWVTACPKDENGIPIGCGECPLWKVEGRFTQAEALKKLEYLSK